MQRQDPIGFYPNRGPHYIDYPIRLPHESTTQQADYTQAIMAPNPLVIALWKDSDKVFSKPLYASAVYAFCNATAGVIVRRAFESEFFVE